MKNQWIKTSVFVWLIVMGFAVMVQSCQEGKQILSTDLVVVEQEDSVAGINEDNKNFSAAFVVDVPINGPQALVDSLMVFVNNELYKACEDCAHFEEDVVTFDKADLFSNDAKNLLGHYMEKYKPVIKDSLWKVFNLTLKVEAQTDTYITYGMEHFHCGGSCGSEKYYYTFDKSDGHLVKDIISNEKLASFFNDNPELASEDEYSWKFSPETEFSCSSLGLLDDHFSLVIEGHGPHYFCKDFSYSQIFSYLSSEAKKIVAPTEENGEPKLPEYTPKPSDDSLETTGADSVN